MVEVARCAPILELRKSVVQPQMQLAPNVESVRKSRQQREQYRTQATGSSSGRQLSVQTNTCWYA